MTMTWRQVLTHLRERGIDLELLRIPPPAAQSAEAVAAGANAEHEDVPDPDGLDALFGTGNEPRQVATGIATDAEADSWLESLADR